MTFLLPFFSDNMALQLAEAINTGNLELAQRLTRLLTLESQKLLSQEGAPSSGSFSMTWEPFEKPNVQKLHE